MVMLALPLVGAGIGASIGGTFLGVAATSWGWAAGSLVARMFAPSTQLPDQFGPRLGDLKVQASTYGQMIPIAFGTIRIAGNVIWAPDLTEHATTTTASSGGKGGGGGAEQSQTTYSYTADCAIAITDGEIIGIRKVWASGKLIYDVGDDSDLFSVIGSTTAMTIYTGSETQTADPTMSAAYGTLTPAYRGTSYVVFNDFAVGDYGNRIPNFEFEVVASGSLDILTPFPAYDLSGTIITSNRAIDNAAAVSDDGAHLWTINANAGLTNQLICTNNYTGAQEVVYTSAGEIKIAGIYGNTCFFEEYPNQNTDTKNGIRSITTDGGITDYVESDSLVGSSLRVDALYVGAGVLFFEYNSPTPSTKYIVRWNSSTLFDDPTLKYQTQVSIGSRSINTFIQRADRIAGRVYLSAYNPSNTVLAYLNTGGVTESLTPTVIRTYTQAAALNAFVGSDGYIYARSLNTGSCNLLEKMNSEGTVIDSVALPGVGVNDTLTITRFAQDDLGNLLCQVGGAIFRVLYATMDLDANATFASTNERILPGNSFEGGAIVSVKTVQGGADSSHTVGMISKDRVVNEPPTLADVVSDLAQRGGLLTSDIDVTQLTSLTVTGYVIANRGPVAGMIHPLMMAYFFNGVESDNKLKFVACGAAQAAVFAEDDLAAHENASGEDPAQALITRMQEMDLPVEYNISYLNKATDYQVGTQASRRLITSAKQSSSVSLALVLTDAQAQQIADAAMFATWVSRAKYEFSTSRKQLKYEPTDVVGIVKDGVTHNVRLTQKDEGANGIIKWNAVAEDSSVYTQTSPGIAVLTDPAVTKTPGVTSAVYLDMPLVRDDDDNPGFYVAAYGGSAGWRGAKFFQSLDSGTSYLELANGFTTTAATVGYAMTVLAAGDSANAELMDMGSHVDIKILSGELASVTRSQILDYANGAIVGDEVIQFQTVSVIGTDEYRLSGLMRGRLGTEADMATHAIGDKFALITDDLRSVNMALSRVGQEYLYKPVSLGRTLTQTSAGRFTNTAIKIRPLSPVHIGAGKTTSGNIKINWIRRTRYNAAWSDSVDAPLGETVESYEVDILDEFGTVLRTISATSPTATYTAAQQTTDFGATVNGITGNVYQISGEYGRGRGGAFSFGGGSLNPHRYWRFSSMTHPGGYAALQLSELALFNGTTNLSSSPATGVTITSNKVGGISGDFHPVNLIDGALSSVNQEFWSDPGITGLTIVFDFGAANPKIVDGVKQGYYVHNLGYLSGFTLEYSDDNVTYHTKGTKSGLAAGASDYTYSSLYSF